LLERAQLAERERSRVQRIREAIDHTRRMTEDLLDASVIESRRLSLRPECLSLDDLLAEACEAMPRAGERFRVDAASNLVVVGDRMRLLQVLRNLLSNAVKYGDADSIITLRADADPDGLLTRIAVENRGGGIPPEDLPRLFNRFARTDGARHSSVPGVGLGLYVCRKLVEAMGGQISATSELGVTVFAFTVPLARTAPDGRTQAQISAA
jgi:signal transduction histidine kinase